jgi:DNA polymerase (family 10)
MKPPADEAALFKLLGLSYIPPELREGLGEIEAAERGELPRLVELADLRGAFHNHTTASDGHNTLAEMAAAAEALGWAYIGIADHSKASFQARGLSEDQLLKQVDEIQALNHTGRFSTHVFSGVECDILPDGRLDFEDDILARLDYVVASVHSSLNQDAAAMTARTIRAVENPKVTMLGHPTSRLLLRREVSQIDLGKVIDSAIERGVVIELNSDPRRLDLDWRHWRRAAERGLLCSINPDAHDCDGLKHVRAGIGIARKGWLTAANVLNTLPLAKIRKWLGGRNARSAN